MANRHPTAVVEAAGTGSPPCVMAPPSASVSTPPPVVTSTNAASRTRAANAAARTPRSPAANLPASKLPLSHHQPHTVVNINLLEEELSTHPDRQFVRTLIEDLRFGSRIGYEGPRAGLIAPNLRSAKVNPEAITSSIDKEVALGRMAGPYKDPPHPSLFCSDLGTVPKKTGGHRTILHLSAPEGLSVNDGIAKDAFSLHYITIDDAVRQVVKHGRNALMCKVDLKSAFRLLPIHPDDWPLLGCLWEGQYYVDKCLPFGLRSAPALFNRLADALEFVARSNYGVEDLVHYLDDYFFAGPPSAAPARSTAAIQMRTFLTVLDNLSVPVAEGEDKVIGPSMEIPMLGILLDSAKWEMRLPLDKLTELRHEVDRFRRVVPNADKKPTTYERHLTTWSLELTR